MVELKSCPFCGGESSEIVRYCDGPTVHFFVSCNSCFSTGRCDCMKEKAAENWNRRADIRTHGHWITKHEYWTGTMLYTCSVCQHEYRLDDAEDIPTPAYCAYCGAYLNEPIVDEGEMEMEWPEDEH